MEYYSGIKNNKIISCAGKWMELEIIHVKQNKLVSQRQVHVFWHMQNSNFLKVEGGLFGGGRTSRRETGTRGNDGWVTMIKGHCIHVR
jgi:hypothetical protein